MPADPTKSAEVFYSYAHEDELLRDKLKKQLANLKRQGVITEWYDRNISPGNEWNEEIERHLNSASVILLLISPDFMDSDYCNDVEVTRAMERHDEGNAIVIPVILRPTDWDGSPFSKLQALPSDARPVTTWSNEDEAFLDVANGIKRAIKQLESDNFSGSVKPAGAHLSPHSRIEPQSSVGFVSRKDRDGFDIIDRLRTELAPGTSRVVALWGAGGVGKTAVAAQAARSLVHDYAQRVTWTTADGRDEFALATLLDEIADQLGKPELRTFALEAKKEAVQELVAKAPTLIVLDNFETVKPKEQSHCLEWLSHLAPASALITTRAKIELAAIKNLPVASMLDSEANEFLDRLIQQAQHRHTFEGVNKQRIIETAEANPLILQWVFAQIDLAQDWREVLEDLAHGEGDAAHRVFDRSFNLPLLNNGGRAALLALSLFVPSASRSALAEVAGLSGDKHKKKFREAIKHLAALWLIRATEGGARLTVEGLTRDLARARLDVDLRSSLIHQRFVTRFRTFAQGHSKSTTADLNAVGEERENVLAAIDAAHALKNWRSAIDIYFATVPFLNIRGYWDEVISRGEKMKIGAVELKDEGNLSAIAGTIADIRTDRGEFEAAEEILQQVLSVFRQLKSEHDIAKTLFSLGRIAGERGEVLRAREFYTESLEINKRLRVESRIADSLNALGSLASHEGDLEEAHRLYSESLEINKKFGLPSGIASCLHNLGILMEEQGNMDEAYKLYSESLDIEKRLRDQKGIATSLVVLGSLAHDQGHFVEARQLYTESLEIQKKLRDQGGEAETLIFLGTLEQGQGNFHKAHQLFTKSLEIRKLIGIHRGIAGSLNSLGLLAQDQGLMTQARECHDESLQIAKKLGIKPLIAQSLHNLGLLEQALGNITAARSYYAESLTIKKHLRDQMGISVTLHQVGSLELSEGALESAEESLNESLRILEKFKAKRFIAECLETLGNLKTAQGLFVDASRLYTEALGISQTAGDKARVASVKHSSALLADKENNIPQGIELLRQSLEIFESLGSPKAAKVKADLHRLESEAS